MKMEEKDIMPWIKDLQIHRKRCEPHSLSDFEFMKLPDPVYPRPSSVEPDPLVEKIFGDRDYSQLPRFADPHFRGMKLPQLLDEISSLEDPLLFKEAILRTTQLYFDGIVGSQDQFNHLNVDAQREQRDALEALLSGLRTSVSRYYSNEDIPFPSVRKTILPHSSTFIKYGLNEAAKKRHLDRTTIKRVTSFAEDVLKGLSEEKIDLIVPIASGGFEPGVLISAYLDVSTILPVRYWATTLSGDRIDNGPCFARYHSREDIREQIFGKKVLVVDDIATTALSLAGSSRLIQKKGALKVYSAVVDGYNTPELSSFKPISKHLRSIY